MRCLSAAGLVRPRLTKEGVAIDGSEVVLADRKPSAKALESL